MKSEPAIIQVTFTPTQKLHIPKVGELITEALKAAGLRDVRVECVSIRPDPLNAPDDQYVK